jgi:hypothetical protein
MKSAVFDRPQARHAPQGRFEKVCALSNCGLTGLFPWRYQKIDQIDL